LRKERGIGVCLINFKRGIKWGIKMNKKIFAMILFTIVLAISVAAVILPFLSLNNDYVCKIGDIKVFPNEYKVYLYEQKKFFEETGGMDIWETDIDGASAENVAKQQAISSIATVKTALSQFDKLNITFSDDELENIKTEAEKFYDNLGKDRVRDFDVNQDDIYNIIKEGQIQKKVFEYITNGFHISDKELKTYFNEYYEKNKADLKKIKIKYIFKSFDKESNNYDEVYKQMQEIYNLIKKGENFDQLMNKYSESSQKEEITMKKGLFESNVETAIYSIANKNETTDIITSYNGFYIFYITEIEEPNIENLEKTVNDEYTQKKKQEIYQQQSEKWLNEFPIEINDEIFAKININDI